MLVRKGQPTLNDVHIDQALTRISVAYMNAAKNLVFPRVFPFITVDKKTDKYWTWPKGEWFRDEAQKRLSGTESAGGGFTLSTDNYNCDIWAFHKDLEWDVLANADAGLNLERATTEFVTQRLLMRQEIQWTTDYFGNGIWGTSTTPANLWSDYVNSDPIADIETGKETILMNTGYEANRLVLGYQVFKALKMHPDIRERFKYTTPENITAQMMAGLFEVEQVLVCKSIKNTSKEPAAASMSFVQGKHALLCHSASSPAPMTPSAGYTFTWTGVSGSMGESVGVAQFDIREKKITRYEGEVALDNKVVATDLGYFFNSVVA